MKYTKGYISLQPKSKLLDYSNFVEGFDRKAEGSIYAIILISMILTVAVVMWTRPERLGLDPLPIGSYSEGVLDNSVDAKLIQNNYPSKGIQ
jgi:hypothetical protein